MIVEYPRRATGPRTSLMMMEFIVVVFIHGETHISKMSALGQQMPQPGVDAKGEGSSTEETNLIIRSFICIRVQGHDASMTEAASKSLD